MRYSLYCFQFYYWMILQWLQCPLGPTCTLWKASQGRLRRCHPLTWKKKKLRAGSRCCSERRGSFPPTLGGPELSRPPGQGPGAKQRTEWPLLGPPHPPAASLAPALPLTPPFLLPNHITCSFAISTLSSDPLSRKLLRHKPGQPLPRSLPSSPRPRPYNTLGMTVLTMDCLLFLMLFGWGGWELGRTGGLGSP